jgi:hypothetical protein
MPIHLAQDDLTGELIIVKFNKRLGIYFSINRRLNR